MSRLFAFTLQEADRFAESRANDDDFDIGDDLSVPISAATAIDAVATPADFGDLDEIEEFARVDDIAPEALRGLTALAAESRAATGDVRMTRQALLARLRRVSEGVRGVLVDQPYLVSAPELYSQGRNDE